MKVQSYIDYRVAGATLQQPEPYQTTMPSHWANAHEGHAVQPRVVSATPPHPYKSQELLAGPLPHR